MTSKPAVPLPRSTPEAQGVPSAALLAFVDRFEEAGLEPHSLMILRHGRVIAESWWTPYRPEGVQLLYSLSKSFTSTAVGLAVAENRLALEERLSSLFQRESAGAGPRARSLTIHRALSMSTGHRTDALREGSGVDPVAGFFAYEPEEEPGSWFVYNNGASLLCGAAVQLVSGEHLVDYLRPRLFDPLGIVDARWQLDGFGREMGYSGLHLTTESIARFGQLLLADGVWDGERVLPAGWVATATSALTDNSQNESTIDWQLGYGYQFWRCQHRCYRGDGANGQYCIVMPEQDAVVVITSAHEAMQVALDIVWSDLLPALDGGALLPDPDGNERLTARLESAHIPVVSGGADVTGRGPVTFVHQPGADHPLLRSVVVRESSGGTELVIDDGEQLVVPCVDGGWPSGGGRFVASGGWTGPDEFQARVVAVQTPHHLLLTCRAGRVHARWNRPPLHARSLAELVAPAR